MTQDPERLAGNAARKYPNEGLKEPVREFREGFSAFDAVRQHYGTLKPSAARGPTNEEILAEASKRSRQDGRLMTYHIIAATKDQSWFKPEPEPEVDRAAKLAQELWDQWTLKADEVIDAQSLINEAFDEVRAAALAKRPRVEVSEEVLEWAGNVVGNNIFDIGRGKRAARFILSLSQEPRS